MFSKLSRIIFSFELLIKQKSNVQQQRPRTESKASCKGVPFKHDWKKGEIDRVGRVSKLGMFGSPERVKIIPRHLGCAFGQDDEHDSHIQVNQGGTITFACKQCDQSQQVRHKNSQDAFLQFLWGHDAMVTAINKKFIQCANGRIMDAKTHQEYKQAEWIAFHKGQLCIDEQGKWRDVTGVWLASSSRARCTQVVFDPQKQPGLADRVWNKYQGFAVNRVEDPSLGRVLEALCSSDVLDGLARLVQFPWIRQDTCLCVANPIVTALEKIFGQNCTHGNPNEDTILQIGESHQKTTKSLATLCSPRTLHQSQKKRSGPLSH